MDMEFYSRKRCRYRRNCQYYMRRHILSWYLADVGEHKKDRENDIKFITAKYDTLIETLKELKEEIRLSRQDRIQQAQRHLQLVGRVEVLESRVNDLRNEMHGDKR